MRVAVPLVLLASVSGAQTGTSVFRMEVLATGSWMTVPETPITDLTTPIHDAAFRGELNAMWRVSKDTAEWGHPISLGGGIGLLRWGAETIYPVHVQMRIQPFKRFDRLVVDCRMGGAFGPWKQSGQGHVAVGLISEMGIRYPLLLGDRMTWEPRFHLGIIGLQGPLWILEQGTWKDVRRHSLPYMGAGMALTF